MFTGLVEELGVMQRLERGTGGGRLTISAQRVLDGTVVGDSVSVSGACLTVVALGRQEFTVQCMPETLVRTTIGELAQGQMVNLERALSWGGKLGGHLVTGHVDAVSEVLSTRRSGIALEVMFTLPTEVAHLVAAKGSIAVDGVSLTVVQASAGEFVVGLIPHTLDNTTLRLLKPGMRVNLEADIIARYVHRSISELRLSAEGRPSPAGGVTEDLLREKGFI